MYSLGSETYILHVTCNIYVCGSSDKLFFQLASEMKEALQNEEFYEGDNPLEQNDDDKGDNQDSDDDYSSEEDDDDTHWGKRGVREEVVQ